MFNQNVCNSIKEILTITQNLPECILDLFGSKERIRVFLPPISKNI